MKLSKAIKNKTYLIESLNSDNDIFRSKALQLGLHIGQSVTLKHCAPIFKDPMLFQVDTSLIAITKSEADLIDASEMECKE